MESKTLDFGIKHLAPCFPEPDEIPSLNSYLYRSKKNVGYPGVLHFFTDDFRFNSIWAQRKQFVSYLYNLTHIKYIVSPDFSTYQDTPRAEQLYNVYRKSVISKLIQDEGYKLIPVVNWSDTASFAYTFDGLPLSACYALPFRKRDNNRDFWSGFFYFSKRFTPSLMMIFTAPGNRPLFSHVYNKFNEGFNIQLNCMFLDL